MRGKPEKLLMGKGESTKFRILLEVARNQPHVKQKDIGDKLGITVQAVSKYFTKLSKEGLLEVGSERADYRLTRKAIDKLKENTRELDLYIARVKSDLKVDHAWSALAAMPIKQGDEVGLIMKDGILYAVSASHPDAEAFGTAIMAADPGEDLGLGNLTGKVKVKTGKILFVKLPSIREGGSRSVDLDKVRALYKEFKPDKVAVMSAVGRAVLNKLEIPADLEFGIGRSVAVAASRGLDVFVLVVGRMVSRMIEKIDDFNVDNGTSITYEVNDGALAKSARGRLVED